MLVATAGLAGMFALIFLHVPLGVAMGIAGVVGFGLLAGMQPALSLLASETAGTFSSLDLATIPLFVLMGGFATVAGLSEDLYRLAYALVGHRRGGLAMATIGGCAGFGAVCGSSVATAATFGKIALPQMLQRGYSPAFATGTVAAGGTLGTLVPPSVIMVIYATLTQELIITLYVAAIVPSILAVIIHLATVAAYVRLKPEAGPAGARMPWSERLAVVRSSWGVVVMIAVVLGGLTFGVFTATEAAAVGAILAVGFAALRGKLDRERFRTTLMDTARTTAMLYVIVIGAGLFTYFITISRGPDAFVAAIRDSGLSGPMIIVLLLLMFVLLGAIFDEVAAMVITLPFVLPLIKSLGYDPVWWGIINVVICELGMIVPPIGINVFVLHSVRPDIKLRTIYAGVTPFILADTVRLALLVAFPGLVLWLPQALK